MNTFDRKYDIVTANLPYIPKDKKIKELVFEPKEALYAKDNGLHYIKIFFNILPNISRGGKYEWGAILTPKSANF